LDNFINNLSIDGLDTSNQKVINDTINQYYKNLFTETTPWQAKLDGFEFPLLYVGEADWWERPFQEDEVH
jgi:hypothetical protein